MGQVSVRTSVCTTKSFSNSDEIWYVGRGRWVMHDGMPYYPIQGQGQGHETFKVRNFSIFFNFQNLSPPAFLMWAGKWPPTDSETMEQYLNFVWTRFSISVLVFFVSHDYELGTKFSCDTWIFFSSDLDEIWYVGRGRWVMHDGMPYDPIQGQCQGHETFKVRNSSIFKIYLLRHF